MGAAAALGGALTSLVYEIDPHDPSITVAAAALVGVVGVGAARLAARRGLAQDPAALCVPSDGVTRPTAVPRHPCNPLMFASA